MYSYCDYGYDSEDSDIPLPEILTLQEVRSYLGVGERTAYRLIQSGQLSAFRIGKLWRIRRKDLEKFCNQ